MTITAMPSAPQPTDTQATFNTKAFAFVAAFDQFVTEVNDFAANVNSKVYLGSKASDPSLDNQGEALQAGTIYYNTALSKTRIYSGSTWVDGLSAIANLSTLPAQTIGTNTNAAAGGVYVLTASLTLTLPASPPTGALVRFANRSGTITAVVARNGQPIMGVAEDMTLNSLTAAATLVYVDATRGWILI